MFVHACICTPEYVRMYLCISVLLERNADVDNSYLSYYEPLGASYFDVH